MKKITKKEQRRLQKKLENKLWKDVRLRVISRDGDKCLLCPATNKLNVHHILEKEFLIFRYLKFDERNLITVCSKCHKFGEFSIHRNPLFALEVIKDIYPDNYNFLLGEVWRLHEESKIGK